MLAAQEWITSHVVDAASIAVSRKHRRAKTDRIDGETLVRTLMAWIRGEPRVCSMVRVPTVEDEDRRRLSRERKVLVQERTMHLNRIAGLLFSVGVRDYKPLRRDRRERLEELQTGDGRPLPVYVKARIGRELDRLELLGDQIKTIEVERDDLGAVANETSPQAMLSTLKGIGPEFASVLVSEGLFRQFNNRRQVAAYAGLAPSPWRSGSIDREQGVSKSGNPRLRTMMIQLAWLWVRYQPDSRAVVPRANQPQWRAWQEGRHCRLGAEATRHPLEIRGQRCRDRRSRHDQSLTLAAFDRPNPRA